MMYTSLISNNKSKFEEFVLSPTYFKKPRKLDLLHTIGHVLHFSLARNTNGYEITSDNYFQDLSKFTNQETEGAARSSICESRQKISWEAFEFLLSESQIPSARIPAKHKWRGHVVRAIDGSIVTLPHSKEIIGKFPQKKSGGDDSERLCHYPQALLVTACNVFTGQPTAARVYNIHGSEKLGTLSLISRFEPGDICLLDRGISGNEIWNRFESAGQYFIGRISIGSQTTKWVEEFYNSGKKEAVITRSFKDPNTKEPQQILVRLLRGPKLKDGSALILATNLRDKKYYSRAELIQLYAKRWAVELMYYKAKTLLQLDKFHARKANGILQEIFANLLVISMISIALIQAQQSPTPAKTNQAPSFKSALEVMRRYFYLFLGCIKDVGSLRSYLAEMLSKIKRRTFTKQSNRRYPRFSRRPLNRWPMAKRSKLRAYELGRKVTPCEELRAKYRKLDKNRKFRAS